MAVVNIRQAFVISKERQILLFLAALPYFHRILESIKVGTFRIINIYHSIPVV